VTAILETAVGYYWRIVLPCGSAPRVWLWLVWQRPDVACTYRLDFATEMLQNQANIGSESLLKLVTLFRNELQYCIDTGGKLRKRFWLFNQQLSSLWLDNTQAIEGLNNEIKHIGTVAHYITWRLLSSRTVGRRAVLQVIQAAAADDIKPKDARTFYSRECANYHDEALSILADMDRFEFITADQFTALRPLPTPIQPPAPIVPRSKWCAAVISIAMNQSLANNGEDAINATLSRAFTFNVSAAGRDCDSEETWIVCHTHNKVHWAVRACIEI
jgi:hypothetical protein